MASMAISTRYQFRVVLLLVLLVVKDGTGGRWKKEGWRCMAGSGNDRHVAMVPVIFIADAPHFIGVHHGYSSSQNRTEANCLRCDAHMLLQAAPPVAARAIDGAHHHIEDAEGEGFADRFSGAILHCELDDQAAHNSGHRGGDAQRSHASGCSVCFAEARDEPQDHDIEKERVQMSEPKSSDGADAFRRGSTASATSNDGANDTTSPTPPPLALGLADVYHDAILRLPTPARFASPPSSSVQEKIGEIFSWSVHLTWWDPQPAAWGPQFIRVLHARCRVIPSSSTKLTRRLLWERRLLWDIPLLSILIRTDYSSPHLLFLFSFIFIFYQPEQHQPISRPIQFLRHRFGSEPPTGSGDGGPLYAGDFFYKTFDSSATQHHDAALNHCKPTLCEALPLQRHHASVTPLQPSAGDLRTGGEFGSEFNRDFDVIGPFVKGLVVMLL